MSGCGCGANINVPMTGGGRRPLHATLEKKTVVELKEMAKARKLKGYSKMKKADLVKHLCAPKK